MRGSTAYSFSSGLIFHPVEPGWVFRLISHAHDDGFRVFESFISTVEKYIYIHARRVGGRGRRNSHPRGTMLRSVDMLRSVTRPRALTRAVFRPPRSGRGSPKRERERERERTEPADVNYFYEIGWCRFYLFWGKQPRTREVERLPDLVKKSPPVCLPG